MGIVASRLSEKYRLPQLYDPPERRHGQGLLPQLGRLQPVCCAGELQDLLLGFGGHELAAGFTIQEENIPAFRQRMNDYARSFRGGQAPASELDVDVAHHRPPPR